MYSAGILENGPRLEKGLSLLRVDDDKLHRARGLRSDGAERKRCATSSTGENQLLLGAPAAA